MAYLGWMGIFEFGAQWGLVGPFILSRCRIITDNQIKLTMGPKFKMKGEVD